MQNGKTEYKSLTISPDATAEEVRRRAIIPLNPLIRSLMLFSLTLSFINHSQFMDLYLDDDNRPNWVRCCTVHWKAMLSFAHFLCFCLLTQVNSRVAHNLSLGQQFKHPW
jgi:hypothetical protein